MNRPGQGNAIVGAFELGIGARTMLAFASKAGEAYDASVAGFNLGGNSPGQIAIRELMMIVHQPELLVRPWVDLGHAVAANQLLYADAYGAVALLFGGVAILGCGDIARGVDGWGGSRR